MSDALDKTEPETPAVAVDPRRAFFDRWFDRWPFGGRMPEMWAGPFGDQLKVEEFMEDDTLVVRVEIPGVDPDEDIEIEVDRGRLRIRAEREQREETKDDKTFRSEFHYGSFRRSIELPAGTDPAEISASYDDGILEVRVPYETESPERTTVKVEPRA